MARSWYEVVIPHDRPLTDELHNKAIGNYRKEKRKDDGILDEYQAEFGTPLSAEEHDFHDVRKNRDYKIQIKK